LPQSVKNLLRKDEQGGLASRSSLRDLFFTSRGNLLFDLEIEKSYNTYSMEEIAAVGEGPPSQRRVEWLGITFVFASVAWQSPPCFREIGV
jgi:hypothetical protein